MTKMILKMVLMLGIVLGISNYMLYLMTGKTPFTADNLKLPDEVPELSSIAGPAKATAYKWRDEHGVVHYSSEPPTEAQPVEVLEVDPNVNLVQGIRRQPEIVGARPAVDTQPLDLPGGNIYNPQTVQKLIRDAQDVQKKLNERYDQQEKILNQQ